MGIMTWLKDRFSNGSVAEMPINESEFFNIVAELHIRKLAFQSGVNLIANAVSKCEFKTYIGNEEVKKKEYYLFNIEPNKNENSSQFIHKFISQLYNKNECLIVEMKGQLVIADSFNKNEYAILENTFTNIRIGKFNLEKTYRMSEVLYFKLNNSNIKQLINAMYENYGKMIAYAQSNYQISRGKKGVLGVDAVAQGKDNFEEVFTKLMNERFKTFFEANNAVLPLFEGYEYNELNTKTYSSEGTRDIKAMIDDIYDLTARALRIPPALLRGELAEIGNSVDNFLTFGIDPLTDLISEEITRKRCGYEGFSKGNYIKIDTKTIKHIDLLSIATAIDKLIASGSFCINDIRKACGETEIDEEWASKHFITKNYSSIDDILSNLGEEVGRSE